MYQYDYLTIQLQMHLKKVKIKIAEKSGEKNLEEILDPLKEDKEFKALKNYLEKEEYNKGENFLFSLLESEKDRREVLILGYFFYKKLSEKSEENLRKNNFSKEEIDEGIVDFLKYF